MTSKNIVYFLTFLKLAQMFLRNVLTQFFIAYYYYYYYYYYWKVFLSTWSISRSRFSIHTLALLFIVPTNNICKLCKSSRSHPQGQKCTANKSLNNQNTLPAAVGDFTSPGLFCGDAFRITVCCSDVIPAKPVSSKPAKS